VSGQEPAPAKAEGKAHKRYEFGVKVSVAATNREGLVLGMMALPGSPYDGHTLATAIAQVERMTGVAVACGYVDRGYVDRGYRGHGLDHRRIFVSGQRRGITPTIRRELRRRSAIEPVIGHMKADGRLDRNFLTGVRGDAINALLCGAGYKSPPDPQAPEASVARFAARTCRQSTARRFVLISAKRTLQGRRGRGRALRNSFAIK
jgi:IS5 family transposase